MHVSLATIKVAVEELVLNGQGEAMEKKLAEILSQKEIERRIDLGLKACAAYQIAVLNFIKLNKPDGEMFVGDARERQLTFTKKRIEEIAKAKTRVDKIEKLFADAVGDKGNWAELENFLKNPEKEVADAESGKVTD